jgi:transposase InsO family protein
MGDRKPETSAARDRWAHLRFSIVGPLLASPPPAGELRAELERLSKRPWRHPMTGAPVTFGVSTIERWYYAARNECRDPVGALKRRIRKDAGTHPSLSPGLRQALRAQHKAHKGWTYKLHADNLAVIAEEQHDSAPSYASVVRYMKSQGLFKERRKRPLFTPGAERARERLDHLEVRSYEAEYVHGLWHVDFHTGSRSVLTPEGAWVSPRLIALLDDCSRYGCHAQWYLDETAETLAHGLSQAIEKHGPPRALMSDNGSAMVAEEIGQGLLDLGIVHERTLPYSPYQNAKQEVFWASVEGRLLPMLEGVKELTLDLLNEATQSWLEIEYNRGFHSEIGTSPLKRLLEWKSVSRESPSSDELRRAFRAKAARTQRRSDGTLSLEGRRFEVPSRYRHLERVFVRYARWNLGLVDLVDERSEKILCPIYPLDKKKNADGQRRRLDPVSIDANDPGPPEGEIAPLLRKLMAEYAATGLPPAYIPKRTSNTEPLP